MEIDEKRLRGLFLADFEGRKDGGTWVNLKEFCILDHFSRKGYGIRERPLPGRGSVYINMMGFWIEVPGDLAMKILVLGEVPRLD